jgi:hypothetical protein
MRGYIAMGSNGLDDIIGMDREILKKYENRTRNKRWNIVFLAY